MLISLDLVDGNNDMLQILALIKTKHSLKYLSRFKQFLNADFEVLMIFNQNPCEPIIFHSYLGRLWHFFFTQFNPPPHDIEHLVLFQAVQEIPQNYKILGVLRMHHKGVHFL